jgi:hypothetical protein
MKTVWIYFNDYNRGKRRYIGDDDWVKVFPLRDAPTDGLKNGRRRLGCEVLLTVALALIWILLGH